MGGWVTGPNGLVFNLFIFCKLFELSVSVKTKYDGNNLIFPNEAI